MLNNKYWAALETAVMFRTVGDYARHALERNYITHEDLYTTNDEVIQKINEDLDSDEILKAL